MDRGRRWMGRRNFDRARSMCIAVTLWVAVEI